jgi:hypothetical protein
LNLGRGFASDGARRSLAQKLKLVLAGKAQPFRTAERQSRIEEIRFSIQTLTYLEQSEARMSFPEKRNSLWFSE